MKRKKTYVYQLTSENLTGLGGPMGTETTWDNWRKLFYRLRDAKAYAEKDYSKRASKGDEPITWENREGQWSTQDLRYVTYHVKRVPVL